MPLPIKLNIRRVVISILATWNILGGFGFYAYVLDSYVNYPENHERRRFKYHLFKGRINDEVVIGISVVMLCQILSTVFLVFAFDESRNMFLIYGIVFCLPFAFASLPVWPIAVTHVSLALMTLSFYFS
ncbi:hypothetical protein KR026_000490 [Drosophila bipectinata]|nr:hypothetical protein KR026_000490 [Drosophila bipectinata]